MRLRLGLLNEDLADRFGISTTMCSNIFKTWIRFIAQTLGKLVAWLTKQNIMKNMPKIFCKAGHSRLRVIIDCSEVFIERPKSVNVQAAPWSDYKSHNSVKFLIGISPTDMLRFYPTVVVVDQVINSSLLIVGFMIVWITIMK